MTSPLAVALALPGEGLEESVLAAFEQARNFDVRRRCLELEDLLGLAQSGRCGTYRGNSLEMGW